MKIWLFIEMAIHIFWRTPLVFSIIHNSFEIPSFFLFVDQIFHNSSHRDYFFIFYNSFQTHLFFFIIHTFFKTSTFCYLPYFVLTHDYHITSGVRQNMWIAISRNNLVFIVLIFIDLISNHCWLNQCRLN